MQVGQEDLAWRRTHFGWRNKRFKGIRRGKDGGDFTYAMDVRPCGKLTNKDQTLYSGSDTIDEVAWYEENGGYKTHEVKKKNPNAKGMYDMSGNVREWCWDWNGNITIDTPAIGVSSGTYRVRRGGCIWDRDYGCKVGGMGCDPPYFYRAMGFRLVRSRVD